jgi:hypothetical protein
MKYYTRLVIISISIGTCITLLISGIQYITQKPGFNPINESCSRGGAHDLVQQCDPNPYMKVGYPLSIGYYNDASENTIVLGFNAEDPELTHRHYIGFIINSLVYTSLAFVALLIITKSNKKLS